MLLSLLMAPLCYWQRGWLASPFQPSGLRDTFEKDALRARSPSAVTEMPSLKAKILLKVLL